MVSSDNKNEMKDKLSDHYKDNNNISKIYISHIKNSDVYLLNTKLTTAISDNEFFKDAAIIASKLNTENNIHYSNDVKITYKPTPKKCLFIDDNED